MLVAMMAHFLKFDFFFFRFSGFPFPQMKPARFGTSESVIASHLLKSTQIYLLLHSMPGDPVTMTGRWSLLSDKVCPKHNTG